MMRGYVIEFNDGRTHHVHRPFGASRDDIRVRCILISLTQAPICH